MRNSGNLLFKAPPSGACLSLLQDLIMLYGTEIADYQWTHSPWYTCRSLDATFFSRRSSSFVLYYAEVSQSIPDRLVRHHIQPWSSLINPNLEGQKVCWDGHVRGNARLAFVDLSSVICKPFLFIRCTQLAKKITKHYEIFR